MLVQQKNSSDSTVITPNSVIQRYAARLLYQLNYVPALPSIVSGRSEHFSPAWLSGIVPDDLAILNPDLVHLHWINGFLSPEDIAEMDVPVVWTMHDMWPFTGGCHYAEDCGNFETVCRSCPQLFDPRTSDLSTDLWHRKEDAYGDVEITLVSPSYWLAKQAKESSLLGDHRIEVIPNGVDTERFKPRDRDACRETLGLPTDTNLVLFGSDVKSERKGVTHLRRCLNKLRLDLDFELVVFGGAEAEAFDDLDSPIRDVGFLSEGELQLLYAGADVTVLPSLQDNLPNILLESMASRTPVAAYDIGGIGDIIDNERNGYLAAARDPTSLASGLARLLIDDSRRSEVAENARKTIVEHYTLQQAAEQYRSLYEELLD